MVVILAWMSAGCGGLPIVGNDASLTAADAPDDDRPFRADGYLASSDGHEDDTPPVDLDSPGFPEVGRDADAGPDDATVPHDSLVTDVQPGAVDATTLADTALMDAGTVPDAGAPGSDIPPSRDAAGDASWLDGTFRDALTIDARTADVALVDVGRMDVVPRDGGMPDGTEPDHPLADARSADVVSGDAEGTDAPQTDIGGSDAGRLDGGTDAGVTADLPCLGPGPVIVVSAPTADAVIETCTRSGEPVYANFTATVTSSDGIRGVVFNWQTPAGALVPPPVVFATGPFTYAREVGGPPGAVEPLAIFGIRGTWQFAVTAMDLCGRSATVLQPFRLTYSTHGCPNP